MDTLLGLNGKVTRSFQTDGSIEAFFPLNTVATLRRCLEQNIVVDMIIFVANSCLDRHGGSDRKFKVFKIKKIVYNL